MDKIKAAEAAVDKALDDLAAAVKEQFPIGMAVKAAGLHAPIECTVSGYGEPGVLVLAVTKSGKTMSRHYSRVGA
jgi:hypothetical protein